MLKRGLPLVAAVLLGLAWGSSGLSVSGELWLSAFRMDVVNEILAAYNASNEANVGMMNVGLGGQAEACVPIGDRGVASLLGLRAEFARAEGNGEREADAETVAASLVGPYVGVSYSLRSWAVGVDIGLYRGGFHFPAGRYDSLVGWDVGLVARMRYSVSVVRGVVIDTGLFSAWLPVTQLTDTEGAVYGARDGNFLDFSGFGLSIGLSWRSLGGGK